MRRTFARVVVDTPARNSQGVATDLALRDVRGSGEVMRTIDLKRCTKCGEEKPLTGFHRQSASKDGYCGWCKVCKSELRKRWYREHEDEMREYSRNYYRENPDKVKETNLKYQSEHAEQIKARRKKYTAVHSEEKRQYDRQRYTSSTEADREKRLASQRKYRAAHPDKKKESARRYRAVNAEKIRLSNRRYREKTINERREYNKKYADEHPENRRAAVLRRRARKVGLPDQFTEFDIKRALDYWHGCCAVCGRPLRDLFGEVTPHLDHWIAVSDPRSDNPGTVVTNMVPLCSPCNFTKNARDPIEWLIREYGKRKANQIANRIETFFEWVKETRYE